MTQRRIPEEIDTGPDSGVGLCVARPMVGISTGNVGSTLDGFKTNRLIYDNRWIGGSKKAWYYDVDPSPITTTFLVDDSVYGTATGTQVFETTITGTGLWTALGYAPSVSAYSPTTTTTFTMYWSWSGNFHVPKEDAFNASRTENGFTRQTTLTTGGFVSWTVMGANMEIPYTKNSQWYYVSVEPKYQSGQATHRVGAKNFDASVNVFAGMDKSVAELTGGSARNL